VTRDDTGTPFAPRGPAFRVVSLVPSLTEAIATTRPEALIGATDWCTHPADLDVARVRGTKNPNLEAVKALRPDVVIANKEENRELDVRRLREAGIPVWVTVTESVPQALTSLHRMFSQCLQWPIPTWLDEATRIWELPALQVRARTAIPIWRDPWMVVGSSTFTGDLVRRLGVENVFDAHPERYPHIDLCELQRAEVNFVLLPDEPYAFSPEDGPEAFPGTKTVLVRGRLLTWYGPSLVTAHDELTAAMFGG
jgi:ABC-type Fe3+-hydroxamate transport system substrate-binding protein